MVYPWFTHGLPMVSGRISPQLTSVRHPTSRASVISSNLAFQAECCPSMGVSIVMGVAVPQNGWFLSENLMKMDDDWGYPYDLGNLQMAIYFGIFTMHHGSIRLTLSTMVTLDDTQ